MNRTFRHTVLPSLILAFGTGRSAALDDATSLYGLHWYGPVGAPAAGSVSAASTDAEVMAPGRRMWVLEINHVDDDSPAGNQSDVWNRPNYFNNYNANGTGGYSEAVTGNGKNHSLIYRLQPNWGRSVPNAADPYTTALFAQDCAGAATWHKNFCRVWQIGNEVNLTGENNAWNGSVYATPWTPTPEQYAAVYEACRDQIHTVTTAMTPAQQIVLMQPNSPGVAQPGRFLDSGEFLWRQIKGVSDPAKIDGFALHSYAEPGGSNDGVDGFMDSIREQLMVIDELGHRDKPVFITEFNKHMPDASNAAIGARFVQKAYQAMHAWNTGSGGMWPGQGNHNIVAACWFVFINDSGGWKDYSLQYQKSLIGGTDPNANPWYGYQAATAQNYPAGSLTGGGATPADESLWWKDDFDGPALDTSPQLPDWGTQTSNGGSIGMTNDADGRLRLIGGSSSYGEARIRTNGYVYGDFRAEMNFTLTDAARSGPASNEANFDIEFREGSQGYSLTFFTSATIDSRASHVVLRRRGLWTTVDSFDQAIPGGINSGNSFKTVVVADGPNLKIEIYKTFGGSANTTSPMVSWNVTNSEFNVGWISMGVYNMQEAQVSDFALGGKSAPVLIPSDPGLWEIY
ncbi:hypothetical protein BH09SUM1_BH09SUM1_27420 [soil metagenome]